MHKFLRAIGFSDLKKDELENIFQKILENPTTRRAATDSEGNEFVEITKEFGDFFGISLRGVYRDENVFEVEYYYPFLCGKTISTRETAEVEKHAEKESYAGICDEIRIGVTLIFYLQNVTDYLAVRKNKGYKHLADGVILGALSTEGKVLLPVNKAENKVRSQKEKRSERNEMIAAARDGDEDALENLTLEDIDMYSLLSRRISHEDILSIVDSYFMPHGIESDQYAILGEITDFALLQNWLTGENVYCLEITCNDLPFSVCIHEKDLLGEPEIGRRFKGNIWLQGSIRYES